MWSSPWCEINITDEPTSAWKIIEFARMQFITEHAPKGVFMRYELLPCFRHDFGYPSQRGYNVLPITEWQSLKIMKSLDHKIAVFMTLIGMMLLTITSSGATKIDVTNTSPTHGEFTADSQKWEGVWFTCEHAQRQRAPDDRCQMFDNEGFEYRDGTLSYLEMKGSQETNCKGQKKGHCFERAQSAITVTSKPIGDVKIEDGLLIVRYWGCEQSYFMAEDTDYMTIKPKKVRIAFGRKSAISTLPLYLGKVVYQSVK